MTLHSGTRHPGASARRASAGRTAGLRRASLAALVLLLIQYGIGIGVNLYVTVPAADQGHTIGSAIANGPGALTVHIVLGLLLILAAAYLIVQAIMARHRGVVVTSVIGLLALIGAAEQGAAFVDKGHASASMTMAILTAVALLCYGTSLYLLGSRPGSHPDRHDAI
ncbi:MAG: hypothetical protein ACRDOA_06275 [Streptosporangiaceae bacterium]